MIVLDTTILVYAVGEDHPLREPSRAIVQAAGRGMDVRTTVDVIQEFTHIRSRRRSRSDAVTLARSYAGLLQPLIVPDESDLQLGLDLFATTTALGAFDCILATTAMRRGSRGFVSADRAFAEVEGLPLLHPIDDLARIMSAGG